MSPQIDVPANLAAVKAAIAEAAAAAGRPVEAVTLVAVTKTHGCDRIRPAILAGHRVFGENRVQEAEAKWPALKAEWPDLRLHLIGPLQRNKARRALRLFDVIETVDRLDLARFLAQAMVEEGRRPELFVQVNIGEEPQKAGVPPADAAAFVRTCIGDLGLPVTGLMCIPPVDAPPEPYFHRLRAIAAESRLGALSMGMSGDFALAVRCGATHVRVGTAIFGEREGSAAA